MWCMRRRIGSEVCLWVVLLLTALPSLRGQAAPASGDCYSAEPAVVERWDTVYRYNADGTGTKQTTVAIAIPPWLYRQFSSSEAALEQYRYRRAVRRAGSSNSRGPVSSYTNQWDPSGPTQHDLR